MRPASSLFAILVALAPATVYSFDGCEAVFVPQVAAGLQIIGDRPQSSLESNLLLNKNAQRSAATYRQNSNRDYDTYVGFFGNTFAKVVQQLKNGGTWLDSGAGRALAPLEKAREMGIKVIPISGQDFWAPLLAQIKTVLKKRQSRFFRGPKKLTTTGYPTSSGLSIIKSVEGIRSDDILFAGRALGLKSEVKTSGDYLAQPDTLSDQDFDSLITQYLKDIDSQIVGLTRQGLFQYTVGFSEKIIPTLKEPVELITDLYGAYHYSVLRIHLLELYYQHLNVSGTAFVLLGDDKIWNTDVIRTTANDIPLVDYLVKTYPKNFSVTTSLHREPHSRIPKREHILVIKKTKDLAALELPFDFNPDEIRFSEARDGYKSATKIIYYPRAH